MNQEQAASILASLVTRDEYAASRAHVLRSRTAMDWTVRKHREGLIDCGALLMICGRVYVHPERFDHYLVKAGQDEARRQLEP